MGAWSPKSFGNDQALDLLIALETVLPSTSISSSLRKIFDNYSLFEQRRLTKTNTYIASEERMRADLEGGGCSPDDIEYLLSKMSKVWGTEMHDSGASEAFEAIAAAEIFLAKSSGDWFPLGEDGQFLKIRNFDVTPDDLAACISTLDLILLNDQLLKECGSSWKKNLIGLLGRVSRLRPNNSFKPNPLRGSA